MKKWLRENARDAVPKLSREKLKQWMLRITEYADRLIEDLEKVDYLEKIKSQQINWIGKSDGTEIDFKVENIKRFNIKFLPPELILCLE